MSTKMTSVVSEIEQDCIFPGDGSSENTNELKEVKDKLNAFGIAMNRATKSIRDIELKLNIKQTGISSIARSAQFLA